MPRSGDYVFQIDGKPLSNMAMLTLLQKRMGVTGATAHGMRSAFADWCEDEKYPHKVSEAALGHTVKEQDNSTAKAYKRTTFFDRRIALMTDWAEFLYGDE